MLVVANWMRNFNTIEYLGIWEKLNNPEFNPLEFEGFLKEAGSNAFTLSPQKWATTTNAKGLFVKVGRGGGTFAHKDIAFKELLKEVDGLRFVPPLSSARQKPALVYKCHSCGQAYQRKRRIDTKRYRCGLCHGKLILQNQPKD